MPACPLPLDPRRFRAPGLLMARDITPSSAYRQITMMLAVIQHDEHAGRRRDARRASSGSLQHAIMPL